MQQKRKQEVQMYYQALGAVIPSRGEYDKFYFKEKEYPIEKIRISRTSEGYIVSLNK